MFGNRNSNRGNQHNHHNASLGVCVCPKCGYSTPHTPGLPCSSKVCPNCKSWLVRSENSATTTDVNSTDTSIQLNVKPTPPTIVYPVVDSELCTGCGVCIDICPTDAIVLKDDKAFIVSDLCRNCKKCVRVCPAGAIN